MVKANRSNPDKGFTCLGMCLESFLPLLPAEERNRHHRHGGARCADMGFGVGVVVVELHQRLYQHALSGPEPDGGVEREVEVHSMDRCDGGGKKTHLLPAGVSDLEGHLPDAVAPPFIVHDSALRRDGHRPEDDGGDRQDETRRTTVGGADDDAVGELPHPVLHRQGHLEPESVAGEHDRPFRSARDTVAAILDRVQRHRVSASIDEGEGPPLGRRLDGAEPSPLLTPDERKPDGVLRRFPAPLGKGVGSGENDEH